MNKSIVSQEKDVLSNAFLQAQSIGIVVGDNQTVDTMGAGLALYLSLKETGKNVQIVSGKSPLVELSNLFAIDKVASQFSGSTNMLTISVPYREGEIEKVSYNIEKDKLNVNLFAEENGITFSEQDIQYIRKGSAPSLIVTVGVSSLDLLQGLFDASQAQIINVDNQSINTMFGNIVLVDSQFSSVCEIVSELIKELSMPNDSDIAQNLMDGISYATRNFSLPTTSAYAFEAAGMLLMNGARRKGRDERSNNINNTNSTNITRPQQPQPRNFPTEEQILNQLRQVQKNSVPQVKNERMQKVEPSFNNNPPAETSGSIEDVEREVSTDVPDDWFLPKVFKGSKKTN